MGSGSSKAGAQPPENKRKPPSVQAVANVNKQVEDPPIRGKEETVGIGKPDERGAPQEKDDTTFNRPILDSNTRDQNGHSYDKIVEKQPKVEKDSSKNKKEAKKNNKPVPNLLQFEDDSDIDDDIDAVLKIPMPVDNSRQSRDKNKKNKKDKNKEKDKENYDDRNFNNNYPVYERNLSLERSADVPETYAQRLQRQQYKLQQDMLIREKTIVRNPREWQMEDNDDEMETDDYNRGFDPSKFRQVNRGGETKKEIFTTSIQDDLQTPRYLQTTGQDLDDVDVEGRRFDTSPQRGLPQYNQSELDLMRQLEEDIL